MSVDKKVREAAIYISFAEWRLKYDPRKALKGFNLAMGILDQRLVEQGMYRYHMDNPYINYYNRIYEGMRLAKIQIPGVD